MTEVEALNARHSVRKYKDIPIENEKVSFIRALIDDCNQKSGLNIQLILDDAKCFDTLMNHYGWFSNVKNYIALVGDKSLKNLEELCGYYGQKILLACQMQGLNSCWVAGTYKKGKCQASLTKNQKIVCVIALGYGENQGREHKSKPLEKVCNLHGEDFEKSPDWFKEGVWAALKAPTAVNQQKFFITFDGESQSVKIDAKRGPNSKIDLGIVKYNFEVASGKKIF